MKLTAAWLAALLALGTATGAHPAAPSQASPEALRTRLVAEVQRWQPVIHQAAIYAD